MTKGEGGQKSQKIDDVFYERLLMETKSDFMNSFVNDSLAKSLMTNIDVSQQNQFWGLTLPLVWSAVIMVLCKLRIKTWIRVK